MLRALIVQRIIIPVIAFLFLEFEVFRILKEHSIRLYLPMPLRHHLLPILILIHFKLRLIHINGQEHVVDIIVYDML